MTSPLGDVPRQYRSVDLATLEVRPASDAEISTLGEADDIQTAAPDNEIARFPSPSGNQVAILFGTRDVRDVKVLKLPSPSSPAVFVPCRALWVAGLAWRNDGDLVITTRHVAIGPVPSDRTRV